MTPKNWIVSTYTVGTWTDLVNTPTPAAIRSLQIACGATPATVMLRIAQSDGTTEVLRLVNTTGLTAYTTYTVDADVLALNAGQRLQFHADQAGVTFIAHGAA